MGSRYGRWMVVGTLDQRVEMSSPYPVSWQLCRCDCGVERSVRTHTLSNGSSQSCGCMRDDNQRAAIIKHGDCRGGRPTRLLIIWHDMMNRCNRTSHNRYKDWGGRGVRVCDEWSEYTAFQRWATCNGYSDDLEIDRRDVNGNYGPDNCRWVNEIQQAQNRRTTVLVTAFGETRAARHWATDARCVVGYGRLRDRIKHGWSHERAIVTEFKRGHEDKCEY